MRKRGMYLGSVLVFLSVLFCACGMRPAPPAVFATTVREESTATVAWNTDGTDLLLVGKQASPFRLVGKRFSIPSVLAPVITRRSPVTGMLWFLLSTAAPHLGRILLLLL